MTIKNSSETTIKDETEELNNYPLKRQTIFPDMTAFDYMHFFGGERTILKCKRVQRCRLDERECLLIMHFIE